MWEKLLGLLKDTYGDDENYIPPSIAKRDARQQELASQVSQEPQKENNSNGVDKGTLIGFNYLKGLEDEQDNERARRFGNLTKLLRGEYEDGKIEATSRESQKDIRRKNS